MNAVDAMSALDELMGEPEEDLLDKVVREFSEAAEDIVVIVTGNQGNGKLTQIEVSLRNQVERSVREWMTNYLFAQGEWENKMRVVNALRAGLQNQDIAFRNANDLEALSFVKFLQLERFPHVAEHFINNGEFMDTMEAVFRAGTELDLSDYTVQKLRIGMFRLYCYDIERERESLLKGSDDDTVVPLEIRMQFSGFHDMGDITGDELSYEYQRKYPYDFNEDGGFYDLFGQKQKG